MSGCRVTTAWWVWSPCSCLHSVCPVRRWRRRTRPSPTYTHTHTHFWWHRCILSLHHWLHGVTYTPLKRRTVTCRRGRESLRSRSRRRRSWGRGRGGWGAWAGAPAWRGRWRFCRPPGCSPPPPFCGCRWRTLPGTCGSRPSWNWEKKKEKNGHKISIEWRKITSSL